MLVNRLLEILVSIIASSIRKGMFLNINCKQFMFRNNPFLIFMVYNFSLKIISASSNICAKSSNSRWMKMAKIGLPKGSGKRLKVREKSVKSQGILKWILGGNPVVGEESFQIIWVIGVQPNLITWVVGILLRGRGRKNIICQKNREVLSNLAKRKRRA